MEDVLASIRRLVSDEPGQARAATAMAADRLVLTPAQRVTKPDVADRVDGPVDEGQDQDIKAAMPAPDPTTQTPVPESMPESTPEPDPSDGFEAMAAAESQAPTKSAPTLFLHSPIRPGIANPDPAVRLASRKSLEARIAELEAEVTRGPEEFEPDGSEPDAGRMPDRHAFESVVGRARRTSQQPDAEADAPDEPVQAKAEDLLETPAPKDDAAPAAEVDVRVTAPEEDRAPAAEVDVQPAAPGSPTTTDGDEVLVDESTLRDMVADIIREEFQGALGERLTRNVRRLVRREIKQALSLKEFE